LYRPLKTQTSNLKPEKRKSTFLINYNSDISIIFLLLLLVGGCASPPDEERSGSGLPNIVLILADDMGFSDLGCYGGEIRTPNLDGLAASGVRFTQFYNAARCCPTRASLLTGLYPHQVGMGGMVSQLGQARPQGSYQGYLSPDSCITIAEALKEAGYRSYMSGKWHVGEDPEHWPLRRGFDRYWGLISGASSYFELIRHQPRVRLMALDSSRWTPPCDDFYMTDAITGFAVEQLQNHRQTHNDQPFFLYVAYTAPHWPLHALPEDIARYEGRYDIGWDSLRRERQERQQTLGIFEQPLPLPERPASVPAWENVADKAHWVRRMQVYAAMVDRMDQGVGRIVETLRHNEQLDNTLLLFLSDNGACAEEITGRNLHNPEAVIGEPGSYAAYREPWAMAGNTPFRYYKSWVHEGGSATPMIAHWPAGNLPKGEFVRQPAHIIDLMPTFLELAGATYPGSYKGVETKPLEGMSLLPYLKGNQRTERTLFWEHFGKAAMRQGDWKIVRVDGQPWELYHLGRDRNELHNLAEAEPERIRVMAELYREWAMRVGVR
jgi:arylsulfatase A-like enzyme